MPDYNFDPENNDYKSNAANGLVFSGAAQIIKIIAQFISIIIMARILSPEDFGLMAMVLPVYAFAAMFSNLGISNAVLQRQDLKHEQVNALFWMSVMIGCVIAAVLCAFSPLVGVFYDDPRTVPLTIALAVLVAVSGLGTLHGTIMCRRLMFRTQAAIQVASVVLGVISSIVVGVVYQSYWALYVGMAVTILVASLGVLVCIRWMPGKPAWADGAGEMLKYGLGIASGNFMGFIVNNISVVAIGKSFGTYTLGLYDRSNKLLLSPLQQATHPIAGVVVPLLHRMHDDQERYRRIFLRATASLLFVLAPGVVWAIVSSETLILFLLGDEWRKAIPLFAVLSLCALPRLLNMATQWLLETQGRSGDFARSRLFLGLGTIAAIFVGIPFGIMGVVISYTAYLYLMTPILWWYSCRKGVVTLGDVVEKILPLFCGLCLSALIGYFWHKVDGINLFVGLGVGLGLSYAITISIMFLFPVGRDNIKTDFYFGVFILQKTLNKLPFSRRVGQ